MSLSSALALLKRGVPGVPASNGAASERNTCGTPGAFGVPEFEHLEHLAGHGVPDVFQEKSNKINGGTPGTPQNIEGEGGTQTRRQDGRVLSLLDALETACRGLPITPAKVQAALAPEDRAAWEHGGLPPDTLHDFAKALSWRREIDQGKTPAHYRARALCASCGPVWHWRVGEALSCPWCRNRKAGRHIPRPLVACRKCRHWHPDRINPSGGLGSCTVHTPADRPQGACWPRGEIICGDWRPRTEQP